MRCPFLREAQVKFCQASPFRKMIVRALGQTEHEKCSSPDHVNCTAAKQRHEDFPSQAHCPFLSEALMQYCSAAAEIKFIPYSEPSLSRCGSENHRYCELYAALANVSASSEAAADHHARAGSMPACAALPLPEHLLYSANHLWLDSGTEGSYHIGIDAFLASVLGSVEGLSFVTAKGVNRPAAVLTVRGVDLQMVFPNALAIFRPNAWLRSHPEKLTSDPYNSGWLFEGAENKSAPGVGNAAVTAGLRCGREAHDWMQHEVQRISEFVHEKLARFTLQDQPLLADGGVFCQGLAQQLSREEVLQLFNEFFSPHAGWRE